MTDLEKLKKTFEELNIFFELTEKDDNVRNERYNTCIRIDEGLGYGGFYTEFYFLNGEIVNHAVWE